MTTKKRTHCSGCKRKDPPEGFYGNGYCKPCGRAYYANWRKLHPERETKTQHRYYRRNRAKVCARARAYGQRLKLSAFAAYGSICACCSEAHAEFLAIDHIDGGRYGTMRGNDQRKVVGLQGYGFYRWLRNNKWPSGFRVLCHNCNASYGQFGYCPHKSTKRESA